MHNAGGGNEPIRRIALEIEISRGAGRFEIDRPHMHAVQRTGHITIVEVHGYPAKLNEFRQFPQHDGGNGPSALRQKGFLGRPQGAAEGKNKDVGIEIKHRRPSEHRS